MHGLYTAGSRRNVAVTVVFGGGGGVPTFSDVTAEGGGGCLRTGLNGGGPAAGVKDADVGAVGLWHCEFRAVFNINVRFIPTICVEFFITSPTGAHVISNFLSIKGIPYRLFLRS